MAKNDFSFYPWNYPLFSDSQARCSVDIVTSSPPLWGITLQVSIIAPHQVFGNWGGVAATIDVGFWLPKLYVVVRLINLREFVLGLLRPFSSNISEYSRLD
jgi:hypothetical protein